MDHVSMKQMRALVTKYVTETDMPAGKVLDVGSMDAQNGEYGTYKLLFSGAWEYVGLDIEEGPNVDLVVEDPYSWKEVKEGEYDLVISGQCLEHVEFPWLTMVEIGRALRPGGLHFNIVPSVGPVHRFPLDTYRYNLDGMAALCKWAGLEVVEVFTMPKDPLWLSTVLVARKPSNEM